MPVILDVADRVAVAEAWLDIRFLAGDPDLDRTDEAKFTAYLAGFCEPGATAAMRRLDSPADADTGRPEIAALREAARRQGFDGGGFGLVGIGGGRAGFADHRGRRHCEDQYADLRHEAEISWPAHLIPLCHWGCGIYSCADVSTPDAQVSAAFGDALYDDSPHALVRANCGFAEWLRAWADGHDMWQALYGSPPIRVEESRPHRTALRTSRD